MSHLSTHVAPLSARPGLLSHSRGNGRQAAGYLSLFRLLLAGFCHFAFGYAHPFLSSHDGNLQTREETPDANEAERWVFLCIGVALVLIGGVFAGLTIALMGQDEIYLKVIAVSGEGSERENAKKVLSLLQRGKHWVLVTLLVGNVVVNETLPLVLDRSLGGGFAAAIISTVLVIVFGEIIPQSACVRFGLPIGAWTATPVLIVMWVSAPITWPIAKLLDRILGEDHGTTYKKAGLKTLVTLHNTMGSNQAERLNEDEVLIISSVLDLKAKPVGIIMTPMHDVFTLSADDVLNEELMDQIMQEGYSRIPVHHPRNKRDFVGMLLVKMLITYDPEDGAKVRDFALATLPETRPETSCLDIINFFQQGKSHMVLVSDFPGEAKGALGVVTLEDVIEELIGEEIIDESDVYIDVHKAIRRMQPAPTHRHRAGRASKGEILTDGLSKQKTVEEDLMDMDGQVKQTGNGDVPTLRNPLNRIASASFEISRTPNTRLRSSIARRPSSQGSPAEFRTPTEWKDPLVKLGPSNAASHPRQNNINTVKVKPPTGPLAENNNSEQLKDPSEIVLSPRISFAAQGGAGPDLVSSGHAAKDGVRAVQVGQAERRSVSASRRSISQQTSIGVQAGTSTGSNDAAPVVGSHSTLESLHDVSGGAWQPKPVARSGSIREDFVEGTGGVRKMVLELTSSSEDEGDSTPSDGNRSSTQVSSSNKEKGSGSDGDINPEAKAEKSKKHRKRKSRKSKKEDAPRESTDGNNHDEKTPLLYDSKKTSP